MNARWVNSCHQRRRLKDSSCLPELLLDKGYDVHGIRRRASSLDTSRIDHLYQDPHVQGRKLHLHYGGLTDTSNLTRVMQQVQPDEAYKLGAQSHVAMSFESPEYRDYREAYVMYAYNRILSNHDSPGWGETFGTRRITRGLANIAQGLDNWLFMGSLDSLRDWGHAKDCMRMQWLLLRQAEVKDYVIVTGVQISVREFIPKTAKQLGMTLVSKGSGADEKAVVQVVSSTKAPAVKVGNVMVSVDPHYFRPAEVETLWGDPTKAMAMAELGWVPQIQLDEMIFAMMAHEIEQAKRAALLRHYGYSVALNEDDYVHARLHSVY